MTSGAELTTWRGECPSCGERVISGDMAACPECGLVRPREVTSLARPEEPAWLRRRPAGIAMWLVPMALFSAAAVATGAGAIAIAVPLGLFIVSSAALVAAGVVARSYRRRRARYADRLAQRHPTALAPQAAAIATARSSLEQQIETLIGIRDRIDFAITNRPDDAAARRRLGTIRLTLETAIAARRMTLGELDAAAADIVLARWLSRLTALTDEVRHVDEVAVRLGDVEELDDASHRAVAALAAIPDRTRRGLLEERWARAAEALGEVRKVLRAEEERLLAVMVRDAIRGVRPIATMGDVPPLELPPAIDLPTRGRAALDQLKTRLAGVRDEVQRCVDEDVRLRAEIEALVEVDRLAPR